ncbi:MAG: acylphosphatase [Candidatus Methanospirareceae archaeon]
MKLKIVIKGKVHDVDYRPFLLGLAESLEIKRFFADNVFLSGKQAVGVLVDDVDDKVDAFIELIKRKKPENAEVEGIDVEGYDGSVMRTESYYRYLTAMQLAKIATYGGRMLEKQDETIRVIREEGEKTRQTVKEESEKTRVELGKKIDLVGEKVDGVGEKVDLLRYDLKEYMESNLSKMREEIAEIKEALKRAGIM